MSLNCLQVSLKCIMNMDALRIPYEHGECSSSNSNFYFQHIIQQEIKY